MNEVPENRVCSTQCHPEDDNCLRFDIELDIPGTWARKKKVLLFQDVLHDEACNKGCFGVGWQMGACECKAVWLEQLTLRAPRRKGIGGRFISRRILYREPKCRTHSYVVYHSRWKRSLRALIFPEHCCRPRWRNKPRTLSSAAWCTSNHYVEAV